MNTYFWTVIAISAAIGGACIGWLVRDMRRVDSLAPMTTDMGGDEIVNEWEDQGNG